MTSAVAQEIVAQIQKWREEFQHLFNTVNVVIDDCQRFEMPMPTFAALNKVDQDISSHECAWQLYEEFTTEREKLIDEEWVSFRAHLSDFQDFIDFWSGQRQQRNLTQVFFFVFWFLKADLLIDIYFFYHNFSF